MKALVFGGTGFIGRRLVENLLRENWDVTIATSGKSQNPFGDTVSTVVVNRYEETSIEEKLSSPPYFDIVFDQIGFCPNDMKLMVDFFHKRIGSYVFVSSAAVYADKRGTVRESDFDPMALHIRNEPASALGYNEGKRNAEAYLFQNATFPVSAARFPNVIGYDDSTTRFQKEVFRIRDRKRFNIRKRGVLRNYVWVEDAGRFLFWLGTNRKSGSYNAASPDSISAESLLSEIGKSLGIEPQISIDPGMDSSTPYYRDEELVLSTKKAESEGFNFTPTNEWLDSEVKKVIENNGQTGNSTEHMKWIFGKR
ncbi:MAG: NAD-dependent epimerase/dehydratase family protein [Thermoplasmataceae archaeon]